MKQTTSVLIEFFGQTTFSTSDGRTLAFSEGMPRADFEIDIHSKDPSDDLPTDVLSASLFVADSDGDVWKVTSLLTSGELLNMMADLMMPDSHLVSEASADPNLKACFGKKVLHGIRFSSDDRFYRAVIIDDKPTTFQFRYTTLTLDLALYEGAGLVGPRVAVFVKPDSLFDQQGESLPGFYFQAYPERLLRSNTAVLSEEYRGWMDSPIPQPLVFEPTGRQGKPNDEVKTS